MHWIWTLPAGDADFPTRRRRIKTDFSRSPATNATFAGGGAPDAERFDKLR